MKVTFLALFLLIISGTQAISTTYFNKNFTSEDRSLIESNGKAQGLLGKLYGNGSIEDSTRLNDKHELFDTTRKARSGSAGGGAGRRGNTPVIGGGAGVIRRPRGSRSSAPSLFSGPHFGVSTFSLYVSLALII